LKLIQSKTKSPTFPSAPLCFGGIFDFGAQGLVVPVVETVPVDTAVEVFDQMEKGEIQGRKVLDFTK